MRFAVLAVVALVLAGCTATEPEPTPTPEPSPDPVDDRLVATSGDWHDPATWGGQVPGPDDDVRIPTGVTVILDGEASFGDLTMDAGSNLTTMPGSKIMMKDAWIDADAEVWFQETEIDAAYFDPYGVSTNGGSKRLNPSHLAADTYASHGGTLVMGIGGTEPAGPGAVGPGHYATIRADAVELENTWLDLSFHYGFEPEPGQSFSLIEADSWTGTFENILDGDIAEKDGFLFEMSYTDGLVATWWEPDFVAANGKWHDPETWGPPDRGGRDDIFGEGAVPGPNDSVHIDKNRLVEVHGTISAGVVVNQGTLVLKDAVGQGSLEPRGWGASRSAIKLNPSAWEGDATFQHTDLVMGLGGTMPAGPDGTGAGYYSTLRGESVRIYDTTLDITLHHGFTPSAGDRFDLVVADELIGGFDGDDAWTFGDVTLTLHSDATTIWLEAA